MSGYVYILRNRTMPGLLKIGRTKNLSKRLAQLNNTSVATPFELVYDFYSENPGALERALHQKFASFRENANREFFRMSPDLVKDAIDEIMQPKRTWREIERMDTLRRDRAKREWIDELACRQQEREQQERREAEQAAARAKAAAEECAKQEAIATQRRADLELVKDYNRYITARSSPIALIMSVAFVFVAYRYFSHPPTGAVLRTLLSSLVVIPVIFGGANLTFRRVVPLVSYMRSRGIGMPTGHRSKVREPVLNWPPSKPF